LSERAADGRWQGLAVLVFGAVVIGFAPILVRLAETGPAAAGFWRLLFATPLLAALSVRAGAEPPAAPPRAALLAGLMFALDLGFWHYGIALTSIANATVLTNLTPVIVTAIAWIIFKQAPRRLFLAAVAMAVSGAWMMAVARGGSPGLNPPLGDALSLATTLWYALYMIAIAQARRRAGAVQVMLWSTLTGLPFLLAGALVLREDLAPETWAGWAACVGLGVMHVAGQGSIAWALGRLPAATASVVVLIQPVIAGALGWVLFAEVLGPWQALGGFIALAGIALAQWAGRPRAAAA
jgi:drug/metabolite transporter (DMT)-like permease